MNAAVQMVNPPLVLLPPTDSGTMPTGELLEFVGKDSNLMRNNQLAQLEAEHASLRQELLALQRALSQKEALLKNAQVREMELRSHLARLMY
jgi:hypothetical protein